MRKILLLPQSAQIKKFTAEEISLMKFSLAECLQGLVTAENLNLDTSEEIFQFITDNPGVLTLIDPAKGRKSRMVLLKRDSPSSLIERFNYISDYIRDQVRANILPNSSSQLSFSPWKNYNIPLECLGHPCRSIYPGYKWNRCRMRRSVPPCRKMALE